QRVLISNKLGEKLVGLLHEACSKELVILCHGFRATKDDSILVDLAAALASAGVNAFRFDFAGNGESEGLFQYGNYRKEADDLRSVVSYFSEQKYDIIALVGHSKEEGIEGRLGKNFLQRIKKDGYIDVRNKKGVSLLHLTCHYFVEY
uniref:Serine aminopeptidase S33 domain-containing protein n=1 Tax=Aegilops tauschii subsp. strangulata TaxID=200361 RepID=A0A452ZPF5_AEGTS